MYTAYCFCFSKGPQCKHCVFCLLNLIFRVQIYSHSLSWQTMSPVQKSQILLLLPKSLYIPRVVTICTHFLKQSSTCSYFLVEPGSQPTWVNLALSLYWGKDLSSGLAVECGLLGGSGWSKQGITRRDTLENMCDPDARVGREGRVSVFWFRPCTGWQVWCALGLWTPPGASL